MLQGRCPRLLKKKCQGRLGVGRSLHTIYLIFKNYKENKAGVWLRSYCVCSLILRDFHMLLHVRSHLLSLEAPHLPHSLSASSPTRPPPQPNTTMSLPPFHESSKSPHAIPTSPQRPKHLQNRSITEITSALPRIPHQHYSKHHHHPHIHHKDKASRDYGVSQLVYNAQGSLGLPHGEGSRSEGNSPGESRVGSRRGSLGGGLENKEDSVTGRKERVVREGEVREERERGVLRATFVSPFPWV